MASRDSTQLLSSPRIAKLKSKGAKSDCELSEWAGKGGKISCTCDCFGFSLAPLTQI
jgi:hypothetical protein